jgi:hypothetical protein
MIPTRTADHQVLAVKRDRGTEFGSALEDRCLDCASESPAIAAIPEDIDGTGGMQALDGFAWRTNGEQVTMDGDRTAEVSMWIERGVLDRGIAGPSVITQPRCMDDRRRDTKVLVMPRTD